MKFPYSNSCSARNDLPSAIMCFPFRGFLSRDAVIVACTEHEVGLESPRSFTTMRDNSVGYSSERQCGIMVRMLN